MFVCTALHASMGRVLAIGSHLHTSREDRTKAALLAVVTVLVMAFAAQNAAADPWDYFSTPNPTYKLADPSVAATSGGVAGKTGDSTNTGPRPAPQAPVLPQTPATTPQLTPGQHLAKVVLRTSCKRLSHQRGKRCRSFAGGKLIRSCTTRGHNRTCHFYSATGHKTRVCTKRGSKKERCKNLSGKGAASTSLPKHKASATGRPARAAGERIDGGSYNPGFSTVVRFYCNNDCTPNSAHGYCSGTLIGRGLVLTAAHCLYANGALDQASTGWLLNKDNIIVTPGVDARGLANYGNWGVAMQYANPAWQQGDTTQDWGIVVLRPDSNGHYAGDYTGVWESAYWGASISQGQGLWSLGYPADGDFNTLQHAYGNEQHFCWSKTTLGYQQDLSSNWRYTLERNCEMNKGSSGGPVFANVGGSWYIVGVNNQGNVDAQGNTVNISIWMDGRFGPWWNAVMADIAARGL